MTYIGTTDVMLEIAKGNISGHSQINKFGANMSSTAGTKLEIWDGGAVYSYPTTALMTSISQTTDQVAMRSAVIEVQGLDASWDAVTQNATLDASDTTTVVTLTTPLIRVFRMKVLADVVSTSPIRIHNAGETQDYAVISTGNNQTLMALYTVPNGKTAYLVDYYGDVLEDVVAGKDPDSTLFELWVADRANSYEFQLKHQRGIPKGVPGFIQSFHPYMKITQKSDIKMTSLCASRAGDLHAGFNLILVNN